MRLAADQETTEEWWETKRHEYELSTSEVVELEAADITDLHNAWKNETHPNFGLQLRLKLNGNIGSNTFYGADYADDPAKRPKLIVTP